MDVTQSNWFWESNKKKRKKNLSCLSSIRDEWCVIGRMRPYIHMHRQTIANAENRDEKKIVEKWKEKSLIAFRQFIYLFICSIFISFCRVGFYFYWLPSPHPLAAVPFFVRSVRTPYACWCCARNRNRRQDSKNININSTVRNVQRELKQHRQPLMQHNSNNNNNIVYKLYKCLVYIGYGWRNCQLPISEELNVANTSCHRSSLDNTHTTIQCALTMDEELWGRGREGECEIFFVRFNFGRMENKTKYKLYPRELW